MCRSSALRKISTPKKKSSFNACSVFSHGNSFPASTYGVMTASLKKRGFTVKAYRKIRPRQCLPCHQQLAPPGAATGRLCQARIRQSGRTSFSGRPFAGRLFEPDVRGPSPRLGTRRGAARLARPGRLARHDAGRDQNHAAGGPRVTRRQSANRRKHIGPAPRPPIPTSKANAPSPCGTTRCCTTTSAHGMVDVDGQRHLAFDRPVETQIYNTLPDNLDRLLKRHPLKCPVAFIGGLQSKR